MEATTSPMRHLTGHQINECNEAIDIVVMDGPGQGGACHEYRMSYPMGNDEGAHIGIQEVSFQNGPIREVGTNGVTHEAWLAILIDRLEHFQRGDYACRENALALTKLQEAQMWLLERTRGRVERDVEGTHEQ